MVIGFAVHLAYVLAKVEWKALRRSLFHPDSLVPRLQDVKHLGQRLRWFVGLGPPPEFDRWTYWEKFDYWAVFWGLPLLGITGLMLMFPLGLSRIMPGWVLNVTILLHRAEALLAMLYIFIVHFSIGHLRHGMFPMNECMFAGSVELEKEKAEKPAWIARLEYEGNWKKSWCPAHPGGTGYFISSLDIPPWPSVSICSSISSSTGLSSSGIKADKKNHRAALCQADAELLRQVVGVVGHFGRPQARLPQVLLPVDKVHCGPGLQAELLINEG